LFIKIITASTKILKMFQVELTKNDGGLIIVNFDFVKTFNAVKNDDPASGTEILFADEKTITVKEPYKEIIKAFTITTVRFNQAHPEK
jgi:hypothetical protein